MYCSANCTSTTQWSRCHPRASRSPNSHTALLPLRIHAVNISVRGVFDNPPSSVVSAEAWALCVSRPHELGTGYSIASHNTLTEWLRWDSTDADGGGWRRRWPGWLRPASAWLLAGRTRLRCSEESSSASPSGRSSSAASRCPGSQTRSCSRRHLGTRTRISELALVAVIFCCFCMKMKSFFFNFMSNLNNSTSSVKDQWIC